jgi:ketosteroid isomerase-like protein
VSQENVEIVRRVYEAAARRDPATVLALYDPEVELDPSRLQAVGLFDRVYHGHDGLRSFFREWHEAWEGIEYDYDELIDAGERVISVVTRHGRGRASGAEVEWPWHSCGRSRRARSSGWCGSRAAPRPSKPPACRSSQKQPLWTRSVLCMGSVVLGWTSQVQTRRPQSCLGRVRTAYKPARHGAHSR